MKRTKYLHCDKCDCEINPNKWDDCEKYYVVGEEVYCKDCFKDWLRDWIDSNLDEAADAIGVPVVEVY